VGRGREGFPKAVFQGSEQGGGDGPVVAGGDAVATVPRPERSDGGHEAVEVFEAAHGHRQHLHELAALLLHVTIEEAALP